VKSSGLPIVETLRTALEALLRNWGRAVLTSLSMVVGTASLVLVVVAGISGRAYTLDLIRGVGSNVIFIGHESAEPGIGTSLADRLNMGDLAAIRQIPGVAAASPQVLSYPTITLNGISSVVSLIGTTAEYRPVRNLQIVRGRFLDQNDDRFRSKVCLVTDILAKKLERDPAYSGAISLYGIRFTVVGVFRERVDTYGETEVGDNSAVIPISVIRLFNPVETIDQIWVSADRMEIVPRVTDDIGELLKRRHRNRSFYRVMNLNGMLHAAGQISLGLTVVLLVIAAISLIASGIGIMNVMLITVTERTREIGIKRAIGALRRSLLAEFLAESLMLSGGGGVVGVMLGVAVPYSVHFFAPSIQIQIPAVAVLLGFGVTLFVGITFGMIPALKASRLNPVDALRYE